MQCCQSRRSGKTLTRVPDSFTDSNAPRSMSSAWVVMAKTRSAVAAADSTSCIRTCTTLGDSSPLAARIAEKSRSWVKTT